MSFEANLEQGAAGELLVERVMQRRGWMSSSRAEFSGKNGDLAPRLKGRHRSIVLPDLLIGRRGRSVLCEVKTYTRAPLNRRRQCHVHGIARRHFADYLAAEQEMGLPVYLFVVELSYEQIRFTKLTELSVFNCQCRRCTKGLSCTAEPRDYVYFNRLDLDILATPPRREFQRIRELNCKTIASKPTGRLTRNANSYTANSEPKVS